MDEVEVLLSLERLAGAPAEARDLNWEQEFIRLLPQARLNLVKDTPELGPDGWPYMFAKLDRSGEVPSAQLLPWLYERGIGLVVNPTKELPDYILTYGMITNYHLRNEFITADQRDFQQKASFEKGAPVHAGEPAVEYLPPHPRKILRDFLKSNGVEDPRILVLSTDRLNYDLCFSLESFGHPPESEHPGLLEALSWFLPTHYSLVLVSESGLPPFVKL